MINITKKIYSHESELNSKKYNNSEIRVSKPKPIKSFQELMENIARISFHNPEFSFFRGQIEDYPCKGKGKSCIYPSIYRPYLGFDRLKKDELDRRFDRLEKAGNILINEIAKFKYFSRKSKNKLAKYRELRWAILQHYEVCPTPLLDVTSSLRVACSIFPNNIGNNIEKRYIFVFGVPHVYGSISYFTEQELLFGKIIKHMSA